MLDLVAVGEGGVETVEKVWHCVLALLATVLEYGFGPEVARRCSPRQLLAERPWLIGPCAIRYRLPLPHAP